MQDPKPILSLKPKTETPAVVTAEPPAPEPEKLYPVKLNKSYRPAGQFMVQEQESPSIPNSPMVRRAPMPAELAKVRAGTIIELAGPEARRLLDLKLADRADALPY